MLEVGDAIVHLRYGAGTVTGTRTVTRDGEERQYYCIEIVNNAGTLLIPQDQIDVGLVGEHDVIEQLEAELAEFDRPSPQFFDLFALLLGDSLGKTTRD